MFKKFKGVVVPVVGGASLLGLANGAYAAVPAAVTDAITGAGTDGIAVATAVLVVIVGFLAFRYMRAQAK